MSTPDLATRLLLASDESQLDEVRRLAEQLGEENTRRQAYEADIVADAKKQVETDVRIGAHNVLVVAGEGWHRGVIGIVASKLVDAFYKPSIVLSVEDGIAHGSCRSIPAFDMLGALDGCADLFEKYGGHKQAAGLTMAADRIPEFRDRINAHGLACLEPTDLMPRLRIDSELRLAGIDSRVVAGLEQTGAVRAGQCQAGVRRVRVSSCSARRVASRIGTSRCRCARTGGSSTRSPGGRPRRPRNGNSTGSRLRLAYSLDKQTFRGETTLELTVADLRCPDPTVSPGPA